MTSKTQIRTSARDQKREEKRQELAEHAILTLSEMGYANMALRDIAAASGVSLGKLQYYFQGKDDLLLCCIDLYLNRFVMGLEVVLKADLPPEQARTAYAQVYALALEENAPIHRLWYDIRNQALFESYLRPKIDEIEEQFLSVCGALAVKFGFSLETGPQLYFLVDGAYRYFLQRKVHGPAPSVAEIQTRLEDMLATLGRGVQP